MHELVSLYAFFALLYLLECAAWVPRRAVGLVAPLLRWRPQRTFCPNASWAGGALFGAPLPPLAPALITEPLPVVAGPDGLASGDTFLPWAELRQVRAAGFWLEVDGRPLIKLATRRGAGALAAALEAVRPLAPDERPARLQRLLEERFDHRAAGPRLELFRRESRPLRIISNLLWATLFLGVPAIIWTPLGGHTLVLAAAGFLSWVAGAVLFERTLRRSTSLARAHWPDLTKRIVAVTSPLATMRSADLIARELLGDLDPLAAAAALTSPQRLAALARPRLVALKFGGDGGAPAESEADARWWRAQHLDRVGRLLRAHDVEVGQLLAPPRRDREDMAAWCPMCLAQYERTAAEGACPNDACQGIALVRY